jgi:hypothetical protein
MIEENPHLLQKKIAQTLSLHHDIVKNLNFSIREEILSNSVGSHRYPGNDIMNWNPELQFHGVN